MATISGTAGNDTLTGGSDADLLYGLDGNDVLNGGDGWDTLDGGAGDDTLYGGKGANWARYDSAPSGVVVNLGTGTATGGGGNDVLHDIQYVSGSQYDDALIGDASWNWLFGGAGNDTLTGGIGNDTLSGSDGVDTIVLRGRLADYSIDIDQSATLTIVDHVAGRDGTDTASNVEFLQFADQTVPVTNFMGQTITGTDAADHLNGTAFGDTISGGGGDDSIAGGSGADIIDGGSGNDSVDGGAGNDALYGGAGDDTLLGGDGADALHPGAGNDFVDGGAGYDYVDYGYETGAVQVDLRTGIVTGGSGNDTLLNIEQVSGTDYNDSMQGGEGPDGLEGQGGDDTLSGAGGNDALYGGKGNDLLTGGGGNDVIGGDDGLDTATYSGRRIEYRITVGGTNGAITVADVVANRDGTDTLTHVERLKFADEGIAFDLAGIARQVALTISAVFGSASIQNAHFVGLGLQQLDQGATDVALMQMALDARLGVNATHSAVVDLLFTNIVGAAPTPAEEAPLVYLLDSGQYTAASLGVFAAQLPLNLADANIELLTSTGLPFEWFG